MSIFITNTYFLYVSLLFTFLFTLLSWWIKFRIDRQYSLGQDLQNIHILEIAYNKTPSQFEISHLKTRSGLQVLREVEKIKQKSGDDPDPGAEYSSKDLTAGNKKLTMMIHENSYWNHYLYKYTFEKNLQIMVVLILSILISAFVLLPLVKGILFYDIIKLIFTFLSFTILYEFLESTVKLKDASSSMLEIDNELSRNTTTLSEENLLNIFAHYVHIKKNIPTPSEKIYTQHRDLLNKGWNERNIAS